ncbi:DUF423 domain-containing protein [Flavobacteriaceae bacterium]|nr:DUF423 domain-containing protein [Flavobacteriaceae bacterium]
MQNKMRLYGSLFMVIAIVLGDFGSHYLKTILEPDSLLNFEVGVRYLIYHGLALFFLSNISLESKRVEWQVLYLFVVGVIFFSGSIFVLSFKEYTPFPVRWLGPLTPIGGLALITAWCVLLIQFIKAGKK